MNWHTFLMGAAASERAELRGMTAFQSHAVDLATMKPLCRVKLTSLCVDESLCAKGERPDCPLCCAKIDKLNPGFP